MRELLPAVSFYVKRILFMLPHKCSILQVICFFTLFVIDALQAIVLIFTVMFYSSFFYYFYFSLFSDKFLVAFAKVNCSTLV